jgi:uncharacterized protein
VAGLQKNREWSLGHACRLFLFHVVTLGVLFHFLPSQKNLATDRAPDLGNIRFGCHYNFYADMIFNEFKSRRLYTINSRNCKMLPLGRVIFTKAEKDFLSRNEACRVATCHDEIPHVAPVSYVFEDGVFFFATDPETRKLENIRQNGRVALVVDVYSSVGNKAVCVQGTAAIIERGSEFARLYKIFHSRFEWVRSDPWNEGEAPVVKVTPANKVSWGLR